MMPGMIEGQRIEIDEETDLACECASLVNDCGPHPEGSCGKRPARDFMLSGWPDSLVLCDACSAECRKEPEACRPPDDLVEYVALRGGADFLALLEDFDSHFAAWVAKAVRCAGCGQPRLPGCALNMVPRDDEKTGETLYFRCPQFTVTHRFCMRTAHDAGEMRHPQTVIREWFPDATKFEPAPIGDCWLFDAPPRDDAPAFFKALVEDRPSSAPRTPI